tara:strand:- start:10222 stop:10974 length:753 start_codon:yes stop_codon:yes gene_type:complete
MSDLHVVSVGRNAGEFVNKCVESVRLQTYPPHTHIVVDDVSDDNTRLHINALPPRDSLEIKLNSTRQYRLKNIYDNAIHKKPDDIICILDTDDWLTTNTALEEIKKTYDENPELEYVYSNYVFSNGTPGNNHAIPDASWNPYQSRWITSHMCTFKAKALQRVDPLNFLNQTGSWFEIGTDHALALPLLWQIRATHGDYSAVKFINKPFYCYLFDGNDAKLRQGAEADERAYAAMSNAAFIKNRGYTTSPL